VRRICTDWLKPLDLHEVATALREHPAAKGITAVQCETSTAVVNDIAAIAALAREHGKLLVVDAVAAAGCMPMEFEGWGLDAMVTASQKGLMSPTGLSLAVLSDRAWKASEAVRPRGYYVQFREIRRLLHGERPETPGSTPVSLIASVEEALRMIDEEGKAEVYARHFRMAAAVRAGVTAMGLALFPEVSTCRAASVTACSVPPATDAPTLRAVLKDDFAVVLARGLGPYKDRVVRIGHMGYFFPKDGLTVVAALEAALHKLGCLPRPGSGTAACIQALG